MEKIIELEEWETVTDLIHIRKGEVRIEKLLSRL